MKDPVDCLRPISRASPEAYLSQTTYCLCAEQVSLLDAGCGEGMYLARVQAALQGAGKECEAFGVDVSKPAIRMAAKRHREASFAVASSYVLPFDDQARQSPAASCKHITAVFTSHILLSQPCSAHGTHASYVVRVARLGEQPFTPCT